MNRYFLVALLVMLMLTTRITAAPWQWSVEIKDFVSAETNDHPDAFLKNVSYLRAG